MRHYFYDARLVKDENGQYQATIYEWDSRKKTATVVQTITKETYDLTMVCVKVYTKVRNDIAKMGLKKMIRNANKNK
jgi:hypothetical protein